MVQLHPPLPHAFGLGDPGDQDVDMNNFHPKTSLGSCHDLPHDPASDSDVTGEPVMNSTFNQSNQKSNS